jgi:hypothetical protein
MKCFQGFKKLFHKHSFTITNAFYTLFNQDLVDIVKVCRDCGKRETFVLDRETLLEVVDLYPNAFDKTLREYLLTWKGD